MKPPDNRPCYLCDLSIAIERRLKKLGPNRRKNPARGSRADFSTDACAD
ncbi:MAG: hypothetical protein V1728_02295 [Candidatus Micrarchaeota archaeon]